MLCKDTTAAKWNAPASGGLGGRHIRMGGALEAKWAGCRGGRTGGRVRLNPNATPRPIAPGLASSEAIVTKMVKSIQHNNTQTKNAAETTKKTPWCGRVGASQPPRGKPAQ